MKKEEFKDFVKKNPILIKYIKNNEMTWQKFYEMYNLYGEDNSVWNDYINLNKDVKSSTASKIGITGFSEVVNWFKNVDLDGLQEGIGNVQRVLGVVQDFSKGDTSKSANKSYKPRPLYKHFED